MKKEIKILIVEDEILIAKEIAIILKGYGYSKIEMEVSGEKALKNITAFKPDIVLMDIRIKGNMDGIETAKIIKKNYNIPLIYLTSYSDKATLEKALQADPYGYILKPVKYEELYIAIEIALYKHKMNEKIRALEKEKEIKEKILLRSQRLASLGELSSSIAHEIRQPLQVIKVLTDSVLYWLDEQYELPAYISSQMENLRKISRQVNRINTIISNMQKMINKQNGDIKINLNINQQIEELTDFFQIKLNKNNISLKKKFNKVPDLLFSKIQFQQIVTNLLNNAIKAFENADCKIRKIWITTTQEGDYIKIEVGDNAIGIANNFIEKIFDPLFTTSNDNSSMGFGLFIVNNILQANNSSIEVINNPQGGATFIVRLLQEF